MVFFGKCTIILLVNYEIREKYFANVLFKTLDYVIQELSHTSKIIMAENSPF
jgi:hypothetical protein